MTEPVLVAALGAGPWGTSHVRVLAELGVLAAVDEPDESRLNLISVRLIPAESGATARRTTLPARRTLPASVFTAFRPMRGNDTAIPRTSSTTS